MNSAPNSSVLLVDDDAAVRGLIKIYLERNGFPVIDAGSGEEALDILARERWRISLLITDVVMPGLSGRDLAARVRKLQPAFPILYISGYSNQVPDEPDGIPCMPKPLDFKRLVAEIASLAGMEPHARS